MTTTDAASSRAIVASELVKTYRGGTQALDGLSFSVETGTVFGLLGPNGAGKSTTVRILSTLSRPDAGSASVAGIDVVDQPGRAREVIGTVGQRAAVDPEASGRENLELQGSCYGLRGAALRSRADELLRRFGLADVAGRVVKTYSGGMQRKLHVAMGLVHRPRVLFLDEPTTGLDPEARAELWAEIGRLAAEDGLTVLLTTHYLEEADRLASRLAIVDHGRVVAEGTPDSLKSELHGDAIVIELQARETVGRATIALGRIPGLHEPTVDGRLLHARAEHAASAIPSVMAALDAAGVGVAAVTVARPSLDDVYLRHTGRAFRPNDEEVAA
jgi:ABC-2 type transport system ATP-binding protein